MTDVEYNDRMGVCFAAGYSIYRHSSSMCERPGVYAIIIANVELARMQGVQRCHVSAVADDFGNLVAVPGRLQ